MQPSPLSDGGLTSQVLDLVVGLALPDLVLPFLQPFHKFYGAPRFRHATVLLLNGALYFQLASRQSLLFTNCPDARPLKHFQFRTAHRQGPAYIRLSRYPALHELG